MFKTFYSGTPFVLLTLTYAVDLHALAPLELSGHNDAVYSVAFTADGSALVSGSYDETVRLWEVPGGRLLKTLRGHKDQIYRISLSGRGDLASGSADGTVRIWDLESGELRTKLETAHGPVLSVAFSANGDWLATAGFDSRIRLWETKDYQQMWLGKHSHPVYAVAFAPDNKVVVSGDASGTLRFWSPKEGKAMGQVAVGFGVVYQLDFARNSAIVTSAHSHGMVALSKVSPPGTIHRTKADASALFSVAVSPDGKQLATGGRDRTIRLWTLPELDLVAELSGPQETILTLAYSADGRFLASGSYDGGIHLWRLGAEDDASAQH